MKVNWLAGRLEQTVSTVTGRAKTPDSWWLCVLSLSSLSPAPPVVLTASTMAEAPAVLYLPLGGGAQSDCQPAAGAKLSQLVPLM